MGGLGAGFVAAAVFEAPSRPFTSTADGATAFLVVVVGAAVARRVARRDTEAVVAGTHPWRSIAVWTALCACCVGVELSALFQAPRRSHPTLSSLAGPLSTTTPGRLACFCVLAVAGWWISR
jgi:hypothetical protein